MKLQYENLTIRSATAADAKQLTDWGNDGDQLGRLQSSADYELAEKDFVCYI